MSMQVPASFQTKFQNHVELALNQHRSLLVDAVMVTDDASADKIKVRDIVGNTAPNATSERHGDTKYSNTPHDGVWLGKPDELYFAELVDNADKLGTGIELEGSYVQTGAGTVERSKDIRILQGAYGSIVSGKEGTTVTPFPAGNIIPVTTGGASGPQRMNVTKVRAAKTFMDQQFVSGMDPRYMTLTAIQADDLLNEVQASSADYQRSFAAKYNDTGGLSGLLGFTFIQIELSNPLLVSLDGSVSIPALSLDGSGYRKNLFWAKSGITLNFWQRLRTSIDPVPTKQLSRQVWAGTTCAATRTQAGRVGMILNSEA
jgi:hypothetical protein